MKQLTSIFLVLCCAVSSHAFNVVSNIPDKSSIVDTARYKATYKLTYKVHPDQTDSFDDLRIVQIGRSHVKDYSDVIFHYDSLATEDRKRGVDAYSNPPGQPWPLEIDRSIRHNVADITYRLPMDIGNLHYVDPVPAFQWDYSDGTTQNILGYECVKATTEFAGRKYTAWFASDLPLPFGPYKFGGLPGLILRIEDAERQFVWECIGFEKSSAPIVSYRYGNEKKCSSEEAARTIARSFKTPIAFMTSAVGAKKIFFVDKSGKTRRGDQAEESPIPYIPLEIK